MDSMEVNKAVAAVLLAGVAFLGSQLLADALVKPAPLKQTAIKIDIPEAGGTAVAAAKPAPEQPINVLLASADVGRGEALVKQQGCVACHSFNEGGKAGVGPNLYGVVGGPHGHMEGYSYSAAMQAKHGEAWTYEALNAWLTKPSGYMPGTKMSYAGLSDPKKRADIIDYLHSLAHDPVPLPPAPVQQASATAPAAASGADPAAQPAAGGPPPDVLAAAVSANDAVPLLTYASADAGKADTAKLGCVACHNFAQGGKNGVGPNLYGVVGSVQGAHNETYSYSAALKAKGGKWDYEELNKWLLKPSAYAPGTKMSYAGIADTKVRADVISYLRTLAEAPLPLPAAQ